jgi:pSer/pThr/pTyr-binding forkhead associated (FHA) protein
MPSLEHLESRLQSLLENSLLKYLPGYRIEDRIFQNLASALQNNLKEVDGTTFAPDGYVILAHPSTLERWQTKPPLIMRLAQALRTAGEEAGYLFNSNPSVSTAADLDIGENETRIIATFRSEVVAETRGMPANSQGEDVANSIPVNAFLILHGKEVIPLDAPVINIGRRMDNQIVIDDLRVSRQHAQLRVTKGQYAIFDLNSSGGTFVNGKSSNMTMLSPGDVISLAGVTLVFGQDLQDGMEMDKAPTEPKPTFLSDTAKKHRSRNVKPKGDRK